MKIGHRSWVIGHWHKPRFKTLLSLAFLLILSPITYHLSPIHAETLSSKELIENAKELDGRQVIYKGELVTAIMNRGEYSWVNLNDGDSAIGIWCVSSNLIPVKFIGDYKNKGDILEVEGIFNRACPVHGGELDIHANTVRIVKLGYSIKEKMDKEKINISIVLFLLILSIAIIFRKRI